jgi:hypothetical protein
MRSANNESKDPMLAIPARQPDRFASSYPCEKHVSSLVIERPKEIVDRRSKEYYITIWLWNL